jgi:UDPglucose--hexose-1-phosphate uridylyltransferase
MAQQREDSTSSEMRHDWLADRWVIMAPQRSARPNDYVIGPPRELSNQNCPFCVGHEDWTPPAVACYASSPACKNQLWSVRVVPNKFPAVNAHRRSLVDPLSCPLSANAVTAEDLLADTDAIDIHDSAINLFQRRDLTGGHEVIVESPQHLHSISQLDQEATCLVFTAYRDRLRHWLDERELAYCVVFKNVGLDAGASLVHTHSQLIATDILPADVARASERMELFVKKESACLFCRMAEDELEQQVRIVERTVDFIAFCPFASRFPSMITILPTNHQPRFQSLGDAELEQLSRLTHRLVRRIEACYPDAAYNFIIHTSPNRLRCPDSFHWRIELFPRITKVAGFEWGSDCYINPLAPESAAAALRRARI